MISFSTMYVRDDSKYWFKAKWRMLINIFKEVLSRKETSTERNEKMYKPFCIHFSRKGMMQKWGCCLLCVLIHLKKFCTGIESVYDFSSFACYYNLGENHNIICYWEIFHYFCNFKFLISILYFPLLIVEFSIANRFLNPIVCCLALILNMSLFSAVSSISIFQS